MATFNADKYQRLAADKNATKTQLKQAIKQAKLDIETVLQTADPDLQKNMKEWMTGQAKTEMNVVSMRTRTFAALIGEEEEIAREIEQSIHDFTYKWDYEIRAYQTGKKFHPKAGHSMVEIRKKADNIESYIRKAPSWQGGVTYRGIELSDAELAPYLNPGYTFDMRGISSWTTSIGTANTFAHHTDDQDQNHVIFICKSAQPRGTSIRGISHYTSEREILLSSAARWRVISWQCLNPSAKEKDYEIACEAL
jgi:hypothetical protein